MKTINWVPGAVVAGVNFDIPTTEDLMSSTVSAYILRLGSGFAIPDHAQAAVIAAIADHAAADIATGVIDHPQADIVGALADHAAADIATGVIDHPQADIVGALADHPVHQHDITTVVAAGGGAALTEPAVAGPLETAGAGQTNPNAVDANAAAQAHAAGAAAVAHAAGVDVAHAAGAAAVAHGATTGANPVVAAVPTYVDHNTLTLSVNLLLGDVLYLTYMEEGSVLRVT